jgi:hypothetical protein
MYGQATRKGRERELRKTKLRYNSWKSNETSYDRRIQILNKKEREEF